MTLYYEDVAVGDTFDCGSETLTKAEIIEFAEQFDPQPFHVDEEAATESLFGELVASGLHTLCLTFRRFVTEFVVPADGLANMAGQGMDDVRWHRPVKPGDTLAVEVEVGEKQPSRSRDDRGYVDLDLRASVGGEDVFSVRSHNVVQRRPDGADGR